jgi:hypothetical protein
MSDIRTRGATSQMVRVLAIKTDGSLLTGLTKDSVNLVISFLREKSSAPITYSGANIEEQTTIGTFQAPSTSSKCRFKETLLPGYYEIHVHDDSGILGTADASEKVQVTLSETTTTALGIALAFKEIELTAFPWQSAAFAKSIAAIIAGVVEDAGFAPTNIAFETNEITLASADILIGRSGEFITGSLIGQAFIIQDYALVSGRGHITVDVMVGSPSAGDEFLIF